MGWNRVLCIFRMIYLHLFCIRFKLFSIVRMFYHIIFPLLFHFFFYIIFQFVFPSKYFPTIPQLSLNSHQTVPQLSPSLSSMRADWESTTNTPGPQESSLKPSLRQSVFKVYSKHIRVVWRRRDNARVQNLFKTCSKRVCVSSSNCICSMS